MEDLITHTITHTITNNYENEEITRDVYNAMQIRIDMMTQLPSPYCDMYRLLETRGKWYSGAACIECYAGEYKKCTTNSLHLHSPTCSFWCGFGILEGFLFPIGHCWNIIHQGGKEMIMDSTWQPKDLAAKRTWYFGIEIPGQIAKEIWNTSSHGDELMDSWKSAVQNTDQDRINYWKDAIIAINDKDEKIFKCFGCDGVHRVGEITIQKQNSTEDYYVQVRFTNRIYRDNPPNYVHFVDKEQYTWCLKTPTQLLDSPPGSTHFTYEIISPMQGRQPNISTAKIINVYM